MVGILSILIVVVVLAVVLVAILFLAGRAKGGGKRNRGKEAVLREGAKRLAQNPYDVEALQNVADIYYESQEWDKSFSYYSTLIELAATNPSINEFEANIRYSVSALKLNMNEEAYKGLAFARSLRQDNFEVNYNLGYMEFLRKNYEKAIQLLQQAKALDPEHAPTLRYLGHSLFKLKKHKEAMTFIRRAIDLAPDDKESLYTLAECYYELNQTDQAVKIFGHLRPDPVMGPNACLFSGTINLKSRNDDKAIEDFEIGLRHQNIKPEVAMELKYRLATVLLKKQEIGSAISLLREIQSANPSYKDVPLLISKYQELNANKNMQIYLMSPQADFVALCRKIVMSYFNRAKIKITNITVNKSEWADIQAEVDTAKWADIVMFRFIRSQGSVGELILRDFHSHIKEVKAGKGFCMTVGVFTDEARRYTEARLIDLIEKEKLVAILNTVDAKAARQSGGPGRKP